MASAGRAYLLLACLLLWLAFLWLFPWLFLVFGSRFVHDAAFRGVLFLNLLLWWIWVLVLSFKDLKAIRSKKLTKTRPEWFPQFPEISSPWLTDLLEASGPRFAKQLNGRVQARLSVLDGVHYEQVGSRDGRPWCLLIGFSAVAVLSTEELKALHLVSCYRRFHTATWCHRGLNRLSQSVCRWQSLLPPHFGVFSFPRFGVERFAKILRPVASELESWCMEMAGYNSPASIVQRAVTRSRQAAILQGKYFAFYKDLVIQENVTPPFIEGLWRMWRQFDSEALTPVYTQMEGLWVLERRLVEACFGADKVRQCSVADWNDLQIQMVIRRSKVASSEMRPILCGSRLIDLPELLTDWRGILKRWCLRNRLAPTVTPDKQREVVLTKLADVLIAVLMEAGWNLGLTGSGEFVLTKAGGSLYPLQMLRSLESGSITAAQYKELCRERGIAELPWGGPIENIVGV